MLAPRSLSAQSDACHDARLTCCNRAGHLHMARHPPVPGEWPAEFHLRDPQGDFRQDGSRHGGLSRPRLLVMPECPLSFVGDIFRHLGQTPWPDMRVPTFDSIPSHAALLSANSACCDILLQSLSAEPVEICCAPCRVLPWTWLAVAPCGTIGSESGASPNQEPSRGRKERYKRPEGIMCMHAG